MTLKTVFCIRHGESTFNAAWRANPVDPLHFDARLSPTGHDQVAQARATAARLPVDVVLVSPLTRALQTAQGIFHAHPRAPRIHVAPLLRERVENSCDIGRAPGVIAAEFPSIDFAGLGEAWWHREGTPDGRGICIEPVPTVQARAAQVRSLLLARPERVIALVGHGTFFFYLTGKVMANCEIVELDGTGA